ncbi:uncharacterized protein F5Z01DRAFT_460859 [Emericellopsis atlantica]|uniref:Integral membrane protein n=1 Tax=Emericellopsis atlantica TaxID=2614577 RepID=A0A9P7ZT20_9HYPO|nr:uncharacterized protein F5Z01DRAFT_460859 [Emericellopsis atlantica]KAG9257252.1 hypothetical protein F5Z01DRAFT_460859 [Emericellopsis atlantica]
MTGYHNPPPPNYQTPRFPSLNIGTVYDYSQDRRYTLYYVSDVWRFTVIWTLIVYALFHLGAVVVAVLTHGWRISTWKYLWAVPIVYLVIAGLEAILAGSIVGVMSVFDDRWKARTGMLTAVGSELCIRPDTTK